MSKLGKELIAALKDIKADKPMTVTEFEVKDGKVIRKVSVKRISEIKRK